LATKNPFVTARPPEPRDRKLYAVERDTRQRRLIREVFTRSDRPLSPEDVLADARSSGSGVSRATVYRAIRSLLEDGSLTVVELPGSKALYEVAGKKHHHHFFCSACRQAYELNGCVTVELLDLPRGFRATSHDVTIFGICAQCFKSRPSIERQ
jgi:Fur family ferric uptake transcriptional regulator